jgi:nucleotide-binding universal stress UspA family protein
MKRTIRRKRIKEGKRSKRGGQSESTQAAPQLSVKLEHILVPIDFSETSLHVLRFAESLAKTIRAQLTLLHVIEPLPILPVPESFTPLAVERPRVIKGLQKKLDALPAACGMDARMVRNAILRVGIPWNEITATAKELNCDLIVIATHGYTGWKRVLMGSTAERVVRHASCPVLVVR